MNLAELDRAAEVFAGSHGPDGRHRGGVRRSSIPLTLDLAPRFEALRDAALTADPVLHEHITGELIASEIEIISGRGEDIHDALRRQRDRRRRLFAHARANDAALGATGTHPWADYRRQPIIDTEHYRRVEEGLQYVAWRNNTFSLHVHVGVRDADRAVRVCDRLRPVLPLLLALSANSPYVDGRPAGLHSARSQIFTRSFPRCGVPDVFGSWQAYRDYVAFLVETRSIVEFTQVWWSIRPHFSFGTVEVRICDAQSTAGESDALTELIVACVAQAARDVDDGVPHVDEAARPDRGEHVAGDPLRPRRPDDRHSPRRGVPGRARSAIACSSGRRRFAPSSVIEPALAAANGAQRQRRDDRGRHVDGGDLRERRPRDARHLLRGGSSMSTPDDTPQPASAEATGGPPPTEEELQAAWEEQLKNITVTDILVQTAVSLVNLAGRRLGLGPDGSQERDLERFATGSTRSAPSSRCSSGATSATLSSRCAMPSPSSSSSTPSSRQGGRRPPRSPCGAGCAAPAADRRAGSGQSAVGAGAMGRPGLASRRKSVACVSQLLSPRRPARPHDGAGSRIGRAGPQGTLTRGLCRGTQAPTGMSVFGWARIDCG